MTRRSEATGTTIQGALSDAVAGLLDCEPEKVELEVTAPGLDDLTGTARVQLEVDEVAQAGVTPEPADATDEEAEPEAEPTATDASAASADVQDEIAGGEDDGAAAEHEAAAGDEVNAAREPDADDGVSAAREPAAADGDGELTAQDLDDEADAAADFLEGLLDAMDLPGDLRLRVHDDHAEVEVVEIGSGALIGRRGQTLEAIQELLRCALQREFQRRARVKVDAEGYRARRLEKLIEKAEEAIDEVLDTGEAQRLEPMDVFERKAVHHLVAEVDGLASRSQGREPARRVVIERE